MRGRFEDIHDKIPDSLETVKSWWAQFNALWATQITWLISEAERLQGLVERLRGLNELKYYEKLDGWVKFREAERIIATLREALGEYGEHAKSCILSRFEAGEPVPGGGYRHKLAGKWYDAKALPECECGLDEALAPTRREEEEGG